MSNTDIQWTNATWNPVRGCSRVSPGCDNCYAMRQAHRFSSAGGPYEGLTTLRKGKVDWRGRARLVPEMLDQPLRWRKPRRIFVNSMSDLFHSSLTNEEIAAVFGVMGAASQHTFQILTKRPERMLEWFEWARQRFPLDVIENCASDAGCPVDIQIEDAAWPLRNVWLGVSVENQKTANERIKRLLDVPAAIRFISAEPLLERVDLNHLPNGMFSPFSALRRWTDGKTTTGLDWVIVGGESGHGARWCNPVWVEDLVKQCQEATVPIFVKQLGADWAKVNGAAFPSLDRAGGDPSQWAEHLRVRQFPRGAA